MIGYLLTASIWQDLEGGAKESRFDKLIVPVLVSLLAIGYMALTVISPQGL
ncbi:MAG: hypothetical protein FWE23_08930 [Chitinivibrionia bacterium]|nr:hypothetical protein [Chitinivibrionia bacterium]